MFETFVESELELPQLIGRDDIQMWPVVYQRGAPHWFYVECRSRAEETSAPRMFSLQGVDNFISLLSNEFCTVGRVYLVTPKHINQSEDWKMESLAEILAGEEPGINGIDSRQRGLVYVMANGN